MPKRLWLIEAVCIPASNKRIAYLFNGGNVLHGVSSVRKGSRIAAVFMFQEERPTETKESEVSSNFLW